MYLIPEEALDSVPLERVDHRIPETLVIILEHRHALDGLHLMDRTQKMMTTHRNKVPY